VSRTTEQHHGLGRHRLKPARLQRAGGNAALGLFTNKTTKETSFSFARQFRKQFAVQSERHRPVKFLICSISMLPQRPPGKPGLKVSAIGGGTADES
jgi:hypothetical protein